MSRRSAPHSKWDRLTARELQCVKLVAEGQTNQQIAEAIGTTFDTAQTHVYNAFQKIGCGTRTECAVWWLTDHTVPLAVAENMGRTIAELAMENHELRMRTK